MTNKDEFPLFYQGGDQDTGYIRLPITNDDFKEFISSLLSRPDTISGFYEESFVFTKEFVVNLDASLRNRIESQNDLLYENSSIKVYYDDDTIEEFSSIVHFDNENCKKYVTCIGFACIWKYLIRFGEETPQSQTLTLSTRLGDKRKMKDEDNNLIDVEVPPKVEYAIQFTNRVWAREIESIIRQDHIIQAIQSYSFMEQKLMILSKYLGGRTAQIFALFTSLILIFLLFSGYFNSHLNSSMLRVQTMDQAEFDAKISYLDEVGGVEDKIDFLISVMEPSIVASNPFLGWIPGITKKQGFTVFNISAAISFLCLLIEASRYFYVTKSHLFILFNEKTRLSFNEFNNKNKIRQRIVEFFLFTGILGAVCFGLLTNFIYNLIF